MSQPNQVAAEEKAEDEDEDGSPEDDDVDIEGEVLKPYIRHSETAVLEIRGHGYPGCFISLYIRLLSSVFSLFSGLNEVAVFFLNTHFLIELLG